MAGYSGTPLPRKLGLKPGHRFGVLRAAPRFAQALGELPEGVVPRDASRARGPFDVIVAFFAERRALERSLTGLRAKLDPTGGLWLAWPKRASGVVTDVTEDVVRKLALGLGLVDNKVCAVDETWSALRVVVRVKDRPGARG